MLPTNKERKYIARKLREKYRERMEPGYFVAQDIGMMAYWYLKDLEDCIPDGDSLFTVLADLIDPDCVDETWCKVCGHIIPEGWEECPRCKTEVQNADE